MLNISKIKSEITLKTNPLFEGREKGNWDDIKGEQTVIYTNVYTDSNGNTYGVMVFGSDPKHFYLCGKVATDIAIAVCNPENGAEFDESGEIMNVPYKIKVGKKVACKNDKTKSYREIELI